VHYVPSSSDLSDLKQRYEWAEAHPEKAQKITERATTFVRSLGTVKWYADLFEEFYEGPLRKVVGTY